MTVCFLVTDGWAIASVRVLGPRPSAIVYRRQVFLWYRRWGAGHWYQRREAVLMLPSPRAKVVQLRRHGDRKTQF